MLYSAPRWRAAIVGGLVLVIMAIAADTGAEFGDDARRQRLRRPRRLRALGGACIIEIVMTFIFLLVILP